MKESPSMSNPDRKEKTLEKFSIMSHAATRSSEKHPDRNEDAFFNLPERKIFGVFDGMGGNKRGDLAAATARDHIADALLNIPQKQTMEEEKDSLHDVLQKAHQKVKESVVSGPGLKDAGTTASVVRIWEGEGGERKAIVGNVGDSRVYVMRKDGRLEAVTLDDSSASFDLDETAQRELQEKLSNATDLSTMDYEAKEAFRTRNSMSQVVGIDEIEPRIYTIDLKGGEKLLIASDGIHDNLTDQEIAEVLKGSAVNSEDVSKKLVEAASARSKETGHIRARADDMTALVIEVGEFPEGAKKKVMPDDEFTEKKKAFSKLKKLAIPTGPEEEKREALENELANFIPEKELKKKQKRLERLQGYAIRDAKQEKEFNALQEELGSIEQPKKEVPKEPEKKEEAKEKGPDTEGLMESWAQAMIESRKPRVESMGEEENLESFSEGLFEAMSKTLEELKGKGTVTTKELASVFIQNLPEKAFPGIEELRKADPEAFKAMAEELAGAVDTKDAKERKKKIQEIVGKYNLQGTVKERFPVLLEAAARLRTAAGKDELSENERDQMQNKLKDLKEKGGNAWEKIKSIMALGGMFAAIALLAVAAILILELNIIEYMLGKKSRKG